MARAAKTLAKDLTEQLTSTTMRRLEAAGHFFDPVQRAIEQDFLPFLLESAAQRVDEVGSARAVVDDIIAAAFAKGIDAQRECTERRAREAEEAALKAQHAADAARAERERLRAEKAAAKAAAEAAEAEE